MSQPPPESKRTSQESGEGTVGPGEAQPGPDSSPDQAGGHEVPGTWRDGPGLSKALESMPLGWASQRILLDSEGQPSDLVLLDVNAKFEELTGLSREGILGRPATEVFPGIRDLSPDIIQRYGEVALTGGETSFSLFFESRNRWFSINAFSPEKDIVVSVFTDITQLKEAEESLRASEDRWKALFEFAPDAYYLSDLRGKFLSGNRAAEQIIGFPRDELIGRSFLKLGLLGPRDIPKATKLLARNALGHPTGPDEFQLRRKDGTTVPVEIRTYPLTLQGEKVVLGLARDITPRLEAEQALRRSERDLRALVDHATYGIFRLDSRGTFLLANPAMARILGFSSADDLLGATLGEGICPDAEELDALLGRLKKGETVGGTEVEWARRGGERAILRISGRPVETEAGQIEYFELLAEDVTGQVELQEQLRQAQKMEEIGQLTGGIAHDFNNLLSVILLHAELLSSRLETGDPVLQSAVEGISEAADRASSMTRQLLGFSRRAPLRKVPTDLGVVVKGLVPMLSRVLPENIEISVEVEEEAGVVSADAGAIEQVLLNLATNARDAMPNGGELSVEVRRGEFGADFWETHPWASEGDYLRLSVRDTGLGMDEESRLRVFEPFFTTKSAGEGTGLGMAMVYGLTKQHDGFVEVQSEVGLGTVVSVFLPLLEQSTKAKDEPASGEDAIGGGETILFVEDEDMLRRVGASVLERHGYRVLGAANGQEALEVYEAHAHEIQMVLTDLVMPKMGGAELIKTLRERGESPKAMFVSGYPGKAAQSQSELDPPVPFLQKPWKMHELLSRVREVLDGDA